MEERLVREVNEKEAWVKENYLYLKENIVFDIAKGETNEAIALAIKDCVFHFASFCEEKINLFVDLTNAGKPTSQARKVYKTISEDERIGKIALVGLHPVARVLAASLMMISGKKDLRFFKNKEEAIAWLKAKN